MLAGAGPALRRLGELTGAVLATSAVANGLFAGDPFAVGIAGGFSSPLAARLLGEADAVVAFGAALNQWTTRHGTLIGPDARVAQVDLDADALGAHRPIELGVIGDARATAEALSRSTRASDRGRATSSCAGRRTEALAAEIAAGGWRDVPYDDGAAPGRLDPRTLTIALDDLLPLERTVVVDSGHFMGWPSMYLRVPDAAGFVFPQAFQCVGLALGNAIGAALARPDRLTVAALGDGGALMALPELETLGRLKLPLLVVIYDDAAYGAEVHHFRPRARRSTWRSSPTPTSRRSPRRPAAAASRPAASTTSRACASGSTTATARWCSTRGSTPTSARSGSRRPSAATERGERMALLGDLAAALAAGDVRVVDLTQPLSERTPVLQLPEPFANTPGLSRRPLSRYDDRGPAWAWDVLEVGEHVGTHFDAPVHWITGRDGEDVASVPPERLVGPAVVIDKSAEAAEDPDYLLTVDDIRAFEAEHGALPDGAWLLLRTGWDARASDQDAFLNGGRTPGPDAECARWLAEEAPIAGFGVETVGTDAGAAHSFDPPFPVHHFLLGAGKYGLTQLANLASLPPAGRWWWWRR